MSLLGSLSFKGFRKLFSHIESFIGLDLSGESIKLVEVGKREARAYLETYGELNVARWRQEKGSTSSEAIGQDERVGMVKDLMREAQAKGRYCVVGVPVSQSFIVPIELPPRLSPKEIDAAIPFEARRYIPVPLDEVVLECRYLSAYRQGKEARRVLLIAVPKDVVNQYDKLIKSVGLEFLSYEIEPFSIVRSGVSAQERRGMLVLDIGFTRTNVVALLDGQVEIVQSISQGSHDWTLALARSLSVSEERAEELKKLHGISRRSEEREIGQVLTPLIDRIFMQSQSLGREFTESTGRAVERIILTGGGSRLTGFPEYFSEVMGLEVRIIDSFKKIVYPATLAPIIQSINPSMSIAAGLALKGFEM